VLEKLKCIMHYFRRVCPTERDDSNVPTGVVTFVRRSGLPEHQVDWSQSAAPLGDVPLHVDAEGTIEDEGIGLLQVDFANKYLGGENRALRMIADAPWYIRNDALTNDLHVPSVREQINRHSSRYNDRLTAHENHLAASLAHPRTRRRLKRRHPGDLWTRGRQVSRVLKQ